MRFRNKEPRKKLPRDLTERMKARIRDMRTHEVLDWAEGSLPQIGRNVHAYRDTGENQYLEAARLDAACVEFMINEVLTRRT